MTDTPPTAVEVQAVRLFRRRALASRVVTVLWVIVTFMADRQVRLLFFEPRTGELIQALGLIGFPVVVVFWVWESRCTVCSGWLRLNGRTCRACGRDFGGGLWGQ